MGGWVDSIVFCWLVAKFIVVNFVKYFSLVVQVFSRCCCKLARERKQATCTVCAYKTYNRILQFLTTCFQFGWADKATAAGLSGATPLGKESWERFMGLAAGIEWFFLCRTACALGICRSPVSFSSEYIPEPFFTMRSGLLTRMRWLRSPLEFYIIWIKF